ncbi:hypothetical protein AC249_AIPGENE17522, partial [Exaiptasia diaphana]
MEDYSYANRSVYDLRRYLISKGITVGTFKKSSLVKLAEAASTLNLQDNVDFHEGVLDLSERLRINGVQMPDPFSIPKNQLAYKLNDAPPFEIEDIFNVLVFKSSEYDRQKIASYKAFKEYALFEDGYVQDLKVQQLNGHFIFVGKHYFIVKSGRKKESKDIADDTQPTQMTVDDEMTKKESKDIADDTQPTQMTVDDEMTKKESKDIADDTQPTQMT